MTTKNTGGPAFPRPAGDYNGTRHGNGAQVGISMRDYFAAKAIQGLLANPGGPIQASTTPDALRGKRE